MDFSGMQRQSMSWIIVNGVTIIIVVVDIVVYVVRDKRQRFRRLKNFGYEGDVILDDIEGLIDYGASNVEKDDGGSSCQAYNS